MSCPLTDMIGRRIFLFGVWEPEMTAYVEATLRPGGVFIDVGANIGYYSMLASRLVGPSGSVVAIEPSPTNFSELKRNIALNHALNIRAIDMAVGDEVVRCSPLPGAEIEQRPNRAAGETRLHS